MYYYVLDGKTPIKEDNVLTWARWFETADRVVGRTTINNITTVSTVFLGLDYQFDIGPPLLFETLVLGGEHDGERKLYSTWEEAEAGHNEIVATLEGNS